MARQTKLCQWCGCSFPISPSGAKRKYCSKKCFDAEQSKHHKAWTCVQCGVVFLANTDHGKDRKFCSRACFEVKAIKIRIYKERKKRAKAEAAIRICEECGKTFTLGRYYKPKGKHITCSPACSKAFYRGANSHEWKGGAHIHSGQKEVYVYEIRPGRVGKYVGQHRLIAEEKVGRYLLSSEFVIRINRVPTDNRPENLFVCTSISEFGKRRAGSLPWPKKSNLSTYK